MGVFHPNGETFVIHCIDESHDSEDFVITPELIPDSGSVSARFHVRCKRHTNQTVVIDWQ